MIALDGFMDIAASNMVFLARREYLNALRELDNMSTAGSMMDEVSIPTSAIGWGDAGDQMAQASEEARMEAMAGIASYIEHEAVVALTKELLAQNGYDDLKGIDLQSMTTADLMVAIQLMRSMKPNENEVVGDEGKDLPKGLNYEDFNCLSLSLGITNGWLNFPDIKKDLENLSVDIKDLTEDAIAVYVWEYMQSTGTTNDIITFGNYYPQYDFHAVGGLVENGELPEEVFSKNGSRPIYGPQNPEYWAPKQFELLTRREPEEMILFNNTIYGFRTNIRFYQYIIPISALPFQSFYRR